MKKISYFVFIMFFLFGCNKSRTPDYVIPPDEMVSVLVDIHLADGMLTSHKVNSELQINDSVNIYNILLYNHGYSRKDFDTSLYYYGKNIALYDKIYHEVLNQLHEMETQLREQSPEDDQPDPNDER